MVAASIAKLYDNFPSDIPHQQCKTSDQQISAIGISVHAGSQFYVW